MKKINLKKVDTIYIVIAAVFLYIMGFGSGFVTRNITMTSVTDDGGICYNSNDLDEFTSVYNTVLNYYYLDVEKEKLLEGAIDGMLNALEDPYTSYMDSEETNEFNLRMQGDYQGIGSYIGVNDDGDVIISQPFTDSPAEKAGLKPMDIILEVDGVVVEGMTTDTVASLIRGEKGTDVVLKIKRDDEELVKTITRANIELHAVSYEMLDDNVGYILIEIFSENSYKDFKAALEDLESNGMESLIIDVRYNSGGYLGQVSYMLSEFVDRDTIIYQLEDRNSVDKEYGYTDYTRNLDVVVLVNEYSASASEILAAGLQEAYGAKLVGTTTYGKGLVQTAEYLDTGGMFKYSNEKWLTPNGNWVHETGITPDYEIELSEEYDNQLEKAIKLLQ